MKIIIDITKEGKVTLEIQEAKATDSAVVYTSPEPDETTFPLEEGPAGEIYSAGAAPAVTENDLIASETALPAEVGSLDGGEAPPS